MQIESESLSSEEKANSILYLVPPFDKDLPRRLLIRLVTMRVLLYRQLASKPAGKYIANPLADLPNLAADLLPYELDFYTHVMLGASRRDGYQQDCVSHFICRMAFSQNQGLRQYFVKNELVIFKNKLEAYSNSTDFMLALHHKLAKTQARPEALSIQEFERVAPMMKACRQNRVQITRERVIKMPFEMAIDAVQHRQAYVWQGFAYFDQKSLTRIVTQAFEASLKQALMDISQNVQLYMHEDRDDQLTSFLKEVSSLNLQVDYDFNKLEGKLTARNVEQYLRCFPPCMTNLYVNLKGRKHLKHSGRLQLGLFLKGAGMNLDQSVLFWRGMFEGNGKNFQKEYLYNIKHSYGKQGAKKNYSPMGCELIIRGSQPKAGEYHGCPFKSAGHDLRPLLKNHYRLSDEGLSQIEQLYRKRHYQVACQLLFKLTHQGLPEQSVNRVGSHPNYFFEQSAKWLQQEALKKKEEEKVI